MMMYMYVGVRLIYIGFDIYIYISGSIYIYIYIGFDIYVKCNRLFIYICVKVSSMDKRWREIEPLQVCF